MAGSSHTTDSSKASGFNYVPPRANAKQRIDRAHALRNGDDMAGQATPLPTSHAVCHSTNETTAPTLSEVFDRPSFALESTPDDELLRLHAADLIIQLQNWHTELDARENQLNTRTALQDLRERQFRQWQSSERKDIEECQRVAQRHESELKAALTRVLAAQSL